MSWEMNVQYTLLLYNGLMKDFILFLLDEIPQLAFL